MPTDTVRIEKLTRTFEAGNMRYVVTAEIKPNDRNTAPYLTVDLKPIPPDAKSLSIVADIYEKRGGRWVNIGFGQSHGELRKAFPNDPNVARFCDIWEQYHLCDVQAGSREQEALADEYRAAHPNYPENDYSHVCAFLFERSMLYVPIPNTTQYRLTFNGVDKPSMKTQEPWLYDTEEEARAAIVPHPDGTDHSAEWEITALPKMYKYGSAWLCGSLPTEVEAELRGLMKPPASEPKHASPEAENLARWAKLGISMSAQRTDSNPNMKDFEGDHWKVTLVRRASGQRLNPSTCEIETDAGKPGKVAARMTLYFSKGYGHHGAEPTLNEIMDTLIQDAATVDNCGDFHGFCSELGYEEDSRTAERTWKASEHQSKRFRSFLGEDLYAELTN